MSTLSRRALLGYGALATVGAATALAAPAQATSRPPGWSRAIYVAAHQDDELLSMGSSIVEHVAVPTNEVIVVCATDGSASAVRSRLSQRLGREVTREQFTYYRDAEMRWTVQTGLGATFVIPPPGIRMVDGQATYAGSRALLTWALATWPGARIKTQSPWEDHMDHRVLGVAATDMHYEGAIPDLRLYLSPWIYNRRDADLPPMRAIRRSQAIQAQAAYMLWAPPKPGSSRDDRYFRIGGTSVGSLLRAHAQDPVSRRHDPAPIPGRLLQGLR